MASTSPDSVSPPPKNPNMVTAEATVATSEIQRGIGEPSPALQRASPRYQATDYQTSSKTVPEIKPPESSLTNLIELLRTLQNTVSNSDLVKAVSNAQFIQSQLDAARVNEAADTAAISTGNEALEEKRKSQRILSWVLCGVGLLVAALGLFAVLFTGGSGLALGIAIVGAAMAALDLANNIAHEAKATRKNEFGEDVPLNLSISELGMLIVEDLTAKGVIKVIGLNADANTPGAITRKSYEDMKSKVALAITIAIVVITLIVSVYSFFKQGAKVATTAVDVAETAEEAANAAARASAEVAQKASSTTTRVNLLASSTAFISALGALANSSMSFVIAFERNDLRTMQISAKQLEGVIQSLQQQFDINVENFKFAMNFQDVLRKKITDAMADFNEGSVTIAKKVRN